MLIEQPDTQQLILVSPILPGRVEAWRRFVQDMAEGQSEAYAASRSRMDIQAERLWINETADGAVAVLVIEADHPDTALQPLATSQHPFDLWFRQQILTLLGHDLNRSSFRLAPDLLADYRSQPSDPLP